MAKHSVLIAAAICMTWVSSVLAQDFSADGVSRDTRGHVVNSKVYKGSGKVRVDSLEPTPPNGASYLILDLHQRTSYAVLPSRRLYLQQGAAMSRTALALFDVGDTPCRGAASGVTCQKLGVETVNGRGAEKWKVDQTLMGRAFSMTLWIDPVLHVVVKSESPVGGAELDHIVLGPQPASLFVIPAGFTQMGGR